jgi:hypothetical protein
MFVIVDAENKIARIGNVPLFGHKAEVLACFYREDDALKILFELEEAGLLKGHRVEDTGDTFDVIPIRYGEGKANDL